MFADKRPAAGDAIDSRTAGGVFVDHAHMSSPHALYGCDCVRADRWECAAIHLGLDPDHAQPYDWRSRVHESTFGACDCACHDEARP